jgi:aspartyl-tRNA(Asn)/glutamyl-tRNA(Gln) amidotransferase subunit A
MLNELTISELATRLGRREVSAKEILSACLEKIQRVDGKLHAFLSYDAADALAQAEASDKALASGATHKEKPLLGIPIGVKDVIAVQNQPLNCGSKILGSYISPYSATVVERLKDAGAVIFGRLNL